MLTNRMTSKGQATIPAKIRKKWVGRRLIWKENPDGSATVRAAGSGVMSFYGVLKSKIPYDPREKEKALESRMREFSKKEPKNKN